MQAAVVLLLLPLLCVCAVSSGLQSGEWVPLQSTAGVLACPQSRTAEQRIGDLVGVRALGAAVVNGPGADLFVQCKAQALGPPARGGKWGSAFIYRYPFLYLDDTGVPVFEAPIAVMSDPLRSANGVTSFLWSVNAKMVWGEADGRVFAAALSDDVLHLLELVANGTRWAHVAASGQLKLPKWEDVSSLAVVPQRRGSFDPSSCSLSVYLTVRSGVSSRAHNVFSGHGTDWRSDTYEPFAGDGIYRGSLNLDGIVAFDVELKAAEPACNTRWITPPTWTGGIMGLKLSLLSSQTGLIAGSHTGLLFHIPIPATNSSMLEPAAAVDSSIGELFVSKRISAVPVGYPRLGNDEVADIIVAGENRLEFTRVDTSSLSHTRMRLQHVGPVLQSGAVLVTGQTPTVAVCDWDGDGVSDLVSGTSEGRVLVSLRDGTTGRFHRPASVGIGTGDSWEEILVQGGYRVDIQGPSESRWGYTAPACMDYDGDGLNDLISSDNSARTLVYIRYRLRGGGLALRRGIPIQLDGLTLHGTWRNGPALARVNDSVAVVTSDEQDEPHLYFRIDNRNVRDGGKLLYVNQDGSIQPIQTNYLRAGGTGRLKYLLSDFDGDGLLDLLLGTCGYHSVPNNTSGLPACSPPPGTDKGGRGNLSDACGDNGATVLFMRRTQSVAGANESWIFEPPLWVTVFGRRLSFGGQEMGLARLDGGLVVATPGGRHLFWAAQDLGTSRVEPPVW